MNVEQYRQQRHCLQWVIHALTQGTDICVTEDSFNWVTQTDTDTGEEWSWVYIMLHFN